MKKSLLFILLFLGMVSIAIAQGFRWQGVAKDASGNPVTQAVTLKFSILKNSTAVYVENQNPITPVAGQISATVGGGTAVQGTFSGIDWANGPFSLNVKMKIGSGAEVDMGTSLILPVPMALWAASSGGGNGGWTLNGNDIYRPSGKVGIGTQNPSETFEVNGSIAAKTPWPTYHWKRTDGTSWFSMDLHPNSGNFSIYDQVNQKIRLEIRQNGNIGIDGNVKIGGANSPEQKLDVEGQIQSKTPWPAFHWKRANGSAHYSMDLSPNSGNLSIYDQVQQKIRFEIRPNGIVAVNVLEIKGGSDLAESFDIHPLENTPAPEPGMLVSIDPDHPGQLKICTETYDRKIAGVISGAGGIQPGMVMGQQESIANGKYPVAMVGRVYVQTDASFGAVRPGDMLTASPVPGTAMKVGDHSLAQGAIIGKAMTSLSEGRGLVLVLANLQ